MVNRRDSLNDILKEREVIEKLLKSEETISIDNKNARRMIIKRFGSVENFYDAVRKLDTLVDDNEDVDDIYKNIKSNMKKMKPSISFAITTHNEFIQLKKSIDVIESFKDDSDELLFLDDFSNNDKTLKLLENRNTFKRKFEKDYSDHKNYLNSLCSCDYILQLRRVMKY